MRAAGLLTAAGLLVGCGGDDPLAPREVAYDCGGEIAIRVVFNPESRIATVLDLGPVAVLLPEQPAGSGFLYATERVSLRGQGEAATITVDGASRECRAVAPG